MKRGPVKGAGGASSFAQKALAAWGDPPEWIVVLAEHADRRGLKPTGEAIGYSHSLVSSVLSGSYGGNLDRVEQAVRGGLMGLTVECPELGTIGRERCLRVQRQPLSTASPQSVRLFGACRSGCPHSHHGPKGETHEPG